jgi:hypothetical protein
MKKLLLFLLPIAFLSTRCNPKGGGCTPSPEFFGTMMLNIKPTLNDKPFVINQVYDINGKKVRFTRLSFLLTETCPKMESENGSCGTNAYLIDLTTLDDATKSAAGFTQKLTNLMAGNMSKLSMGFGVAANLNSSKPKDFGGTNPLSDAGLYWDSWNSYIFSKLEGLMDKDGDGKFETGITLHTGGNDGFRSTIFAKSFTVDATNATTLNFDLNVNTLLRGIDLATVNSTHQTGDAPTMLKLMDNLRDGMVIR